MVLAVGNLLDRHVLDSIGIRLELVDIQHKDIALDLLGFSTRSVVIKAVNSHPSGRNLV